MTMCSIIIVGCQTIAFVFRQLDMYNKFCVRRSRRIMSTRSIDRHYWFFYADIDCFCRKCCSDRDVVIECFKEIFDYELRYL